MHAARNDCLERNCSHICLLSASNTNGYTCACPPGLELDENSRDCKGAGSTACVSNDVLTKYLYTYIQLLLDSCLRCNHHIFAALMLMVVTVQHCILVVTQ